jgi:hypothetical protein
MKRTAVVFALVASLLFVGTGAVTSHTYLAEHRHCTAVPDERDITVTTDKTVYVYGETVNITVTNTGAVAIAAIPKLKLFYVAPDGYHHLIREPLVEELSFGLAPGERFSYLWNQKDDGGAQVANGEYFIYFYFIICSGVQASNSTTVYIQGPAYVETIAGGLGASAVIKNIGDKALSEIRWTVDLAGLVFSGAHTEGIIPYLPAGETVRIGTSLAFGIGQVTIAVTVRPDGEKTARCLLLGPLVLNVT